MEVVEVVEAVEAEEAEAERRQPAVWLQEEEETQNSSERNHPPSAGIDKTSTDSCQTSKNTCP